MTNYRPGARMPNGEFMPLTLPSTWAKFLALCAALGVPLKDPTP